MRTKKLVVAAALLGAVVVLAGCGLRQADGPIEHDAASYDVSDAVAAIEVNGDAGTIDVVESDRAGIHVTENLEWRETKPSPVHAVEGDSLVLRYTCPRRASLGTRCNVNYQVEIPRGLRVKVGTDSGAVTLTALSGAVDAESDSGEIGASGLAGKQVGVRSDSGNVVLGFTGQPDKVELETDSGSGVVRLPPGTYNVTAQTDSGMKRVSVPTDPAAPRSINVTTDSGDLEVSAA